MNKVTFNINQLGAIKDSKIEMKPFMLFSGESGLGKSYAAFLIHYLYVVLINDRLNNFFVEKNYDLASIFNNKISGKVLFSIPVQDVFSWMNKDAICLLYTSPSPRD